MRTLGIMSGLLAIVLASPFQNAGGAPPKKADDIRNPFDVKDIPEPNDEVTEALAKKVKLEGDAKDANAEQWVKVASEGKKGSLEGEWSDRWNGNGGDWYDGTGATKIRVIKDRVYMLVNASTGKYLIDLKREKNRLVGKYQGVDSPNDTGPIVLLIVDDERIDGNWGDHGRWDFRRKLK